MNNIIVHDVTKITDIKFEPIEYDNYFVKKYCPINRHSDIPLHKFWLIAEKCKVINVFGNNYVSDGNITVVFANKSKYVNDRLDIENKIRSHFKKKLHTDSNLETTYKFLYDKSTVFFNSNDEEEKYNICVGNEFDLVVELNYVELCAKHINFVWKIVQIKKIKMIDLKISLFSKQPQIQHQFYQPEQHVLPQPVVQFKPSFVPSIAELQPLKKQPEIPQKPIQSKPISIAFTPGLLQNALSKLKKPKNILEEELVHLPIENEQIVTQLCSLKHVITHETSVIDIFKKEYRETIKKDYHLLQQINLNMDIIFENANNNILTGLQLLKKMDRLTQYGRISDHS